MELPQRAREVLAAVVREYILTGEAVASQSVVGRQGVEKSSATVRNIMADLEGQGFLKQPHTSAGRVPTESGIRFFVDRLMRTRQLSQREKEDIRARYNISNVELQSLLREISKLLSDLSKQCALVQVPRSDVAQLSRIEFIPISKGRLIVVLVMSSGLVENRLITSEKDLAGSELEKVHAYLNDLCSGKKLSEIRELVAAQLQAEQVRYDDFKRRALELGSEALAAPIEPDVVIEGRSNLFERADQQAEQVKSLLHAIEERKLVLRLLDQTMGDAQGVKVFIGSENQEDDFRDCAIVAASYGAEDVLGSVGVVGPSNMNYPRVIPVVGFAAGILTQVLSEEE